MWVYMLTNKLADFSCSDQVNPLLPDRIHHPICPHLRALLLLGIYPYHAPDSIYIYQHVTWYLLRSKRTKDRCDWYHSESPLCSM